MVPDAGEVALDQLMVESDTRLVMVLRATGEASHCPECRQESRRIHSRYRRRLSDLPWEGIPVRIELRVRRFFCDNALMWLRRELEDGPRAVKAIQDAAEQAGHSWRTIERAKKELGAEAKQGPNGWTWELVGDGLPV